MYFSCQKEAFFSCVRGSVSCSDFQRSCLSYTALLYCTATQQATDMSAFWSAVTATVGVVTERNAEKAIEELKAYEVGMVMWHVLHMCV